MELWEGTGLTAGERGTTAGQTGKVQGAGHLGGWQHGESLAEQAAAGDRPFGGAFKATALWDGFSGFSGPGISSSGGGSSGFRCNSKGDKWSMSTPHNASHQK